MKTKKNYITINKIFSDLIAKNFIYILMILILSIGLSFFYNKLIKDKLYTYSIKINSPTNFNIKEINLDLNTTALLERFLINYMNNIDVDLIDKDIFTDKSNVSIKFSSTHNLIEIDNILEIINADLNDYILETLNFKLSQIEMVNFPNYNLSDISDNINYLNYINKEITTKTIKLYLENFNIISDNLKFTSLNGVQKKNNIFTNIEIIFAGLVFGILISSIILFLKSNYFRKFFL